MGTRLVYAIFLWLGLFQPNILLAAAPTHHLPTLAYDVLAIDSNISEQHRYYGDLAGDPHTFEFSLGQESELVIRLLQADTQEPIPFSLIAVRENDSGKGVTEIGRMSGKNLDWEDYTDTALGLYFKRAPEFRRTLQSGLYRMEISTPENHGKYLLIVGEERQSDGYFAELGYIRELQKFFSASPLHIFRSSYVAYPLGSLFILVLLFFTWRYKAVIQQITSHD